MNVHRSKLGMCAPLAWVLLSLAVFAFAAPIQLVSRLNSGQVSPAGGNGDSCLPVLSADARYVLFASTANNLVLNSNGVSIPSLTPARFNVYLRNRASQTTTLVSVNTSGTVGGNGDSFPVALSTNGQFALFASGASDLAANDTNNATDIFLRDLAAGTTTLVSAATNGFAGNGASRGAVMTPDGRYASFVSEASNLVPGDTNKIADVFVRDMQTLATTLVSVGAISTNPSAIVPVSSSEAPEITPDGRFIAFTSTATNLVTGVRSTGDVYVRDVTLGTNIWVSAGMRSVLQSATGKTNGICFDLALSDDGKFVAFQACVAPSSGVNTGIVLRAGLDTGITDVIHTNSPVSILTATDTRNLAMTPDGAFIAYAANSNSATSIRVWDAATGTSTLVSGNLTNAVTSGSLSSRPVIDPTGRYVAFLSSAPALVTNVVSGAWHVYRRDLATATTTLVDTDTNGASGRVTELTVPGLSADGRFVAYESADASLVPEDNNHSLDTFVRDLVAGTNELVSARDAALNSITPNGPSISSAFSASADGRYIAYASEADNLAAGDTNGFRDVFVRDLAGGTNWLISSGLGGGGNGMAWEPAISGDGRYVAFTSNSTNLVAGDANKGSDIFVRELQTGVTVLASQNAAGTGPANKASDSPTLNSAGRWLLFRSEATDLAAGSFSGTNLFLRDLLLSTNFSLTTSGVNAQVMTPSGQFVAFVGGVPGVATRYVYVRDTELGHLVFTNFTAGALNLAVSADGNLLAFTTATNLWVADRAAQTNWLVASFTSSSRPIPRFNADGSWLTYARLSGLWQQTYLYDVRNRVEFLVSHALNSAAEGGGHSDAPEISPDGRFVAYRTQATNVISGANGYMRQLVLYDRQAGLNQLVSASRLTGLPADDHSMRGRFSADGQTLLMQSWASDIAANDFNRSGDVLAYTIFTAVIFPSPPGQGPWLSWPFVPGNNYSVDFKNSFSDPSWQPLPGNFTNSGVKAWQQDTVPNGGQRFYRIVLF